MSAMAAGGSFTCALTTAHAVKCWGNNSFGQVGDGTFTGRTSPVPVLGLSRGAGTQDPLTAQCWVRRPSPWL